MKLVFWDIEAGGLKAPFDQVLCSAFKPYGKKPFAYTRSPKDETDKELCIKIRDELKKWDVIIGYYSLNFDLPFAPAPPSW